MQTSSSNQWGVYDQDPRNRHVSNRFVIDTSMEEQYLETILEVDSIKSKRSSVNIAGADHSYRALPAAVQRLQHSQPSWGQSSSTMSDWRTEDNSRHSYSDISPISTPRKSWGASEFDLAPVSPIEPMPKATARAPWMEQRLKSQIPRRVTPVITRKAVPVTVKGDKEPTKWDPYSGEQTKAETGVISSVRPGGIQPVEEQYPQLKERTKQILADLRKRGQMRRGESPTSPVSVETDSLDQPAVHKEPWKGASGRTAIVDPVQDTPAARDGPLQRAQQNVIKIETDSIPDYTDAAISETPQTIRGRDEFPSQEVEQTEKQRSHSPQIHRIASEEELAPPAPLKIAPKSRTPSPPQLTFTQPRSATYPHPEYSRPEFYPEYHAQSPPRSAEPKLLQSPFRSPVPPRGFDEPLPLSSTRTESPQHEASPRTPSPAAYSQGFESKSEPSPPVMEHEPEVSRFSWTTYATSVSDSPHSGAHVMRNESPPPPLPTMPAIHMRPTAASKYNDNLYMNADAARSQGSIVVRKPVPVPSLTVPVPPNRKQPNRNQRQQPPHPLSVSKTLPQIPPEMEAADKISGFEAQIEDLNRQKHNLNRIKRDLKASLEINRIAYDIFKRKEVERQIEDRDKELQALEKEEHDIGLKLFRAMKKRDTEDGYELPTGLWIRRVTT